MNNPVFSIHAFARFPALTFRYGIALSIDDRERNIASA